RGLAVGDDVLFGGVQDHALRARHTWDRRVHVAPRVVYEPGRRDELRRPAARVRHGLAARRGLHLPGDRVAVRSAGPVAADAALAGDPRHAGGVDLHVV